ncbi:hypothetical protein BGX38DRAFT_1162527 [Terfezia claveryi]|nr:hypothetical protein BGX38DRAFT_1162527 [Terfezia claveryi]
MSMSLSSRGPSSPAILAASFVYMAHCIFFLLQNCTLDPARALDTLQIPSPLLPYPCKALAAYLLSIYPELCGSNIIKAHKLPCHHNGNL